MNLIKGKKSSDFRSQLNFLWLIVFIPFFIIQILFVFSWITNRYRRALDTNDALAMSISNSFSEFVHNVIRDEVILGIVINSDSTTQKAANGLLQATDSQYQAVQSIVYISKTGKLLASSNSYFKIDSLLLLELNKIPDTAVYYVGNLVDGLLENRPGFIISHSIHTNNNDGFIVALIDPSQFSKAVMKINSFGIESYTLFDKKGVLVYSNLHSDIKYKQRILWVKKDSLLRGAMRGNVTSGHYNSPIDGSRLVGSRIPIPEYQWVAGAGRPFSVMFKPIIRTTSITILLTILTIIIIILFGRKVINTIINALSKLQIHAKALSAENFMFTTPQSGIVEFDSLINNFNKLGNQLEKRDEEIKSRTDDLQKSNVELELTMKELESFTYTVSHDLRGPLRTIEGFSQILQQDFSNNLDSEGKQFINRIISAAKKMNYLIDDLLYLSKVNRYEMNRQKVDLGSEVSNILDELQKNEPDRKIELRITKDIYVSADPRLTHLAIENLINNAWKFTKKNSLPVIEFGKTKTDKGMAYYVKDNGAGFNEQYAEKLFMPFQRLHNETEFPGTGIGLAIVEKVIRRHNGLIWAESKIGEGATFYFTLGE